MSGGIQVEVSCYSGYKGSEEPRSFVLGGNRHEIEQIVDRWYEPEYVYFKVKTRENNEYILKYAGKNDAWELIFFKKDPSR